MPSPDDCGMVEYNFLGAAASVLDQPMVFKGTFFPTFQLVRAAAPIPGRGLWVISFSKLHRCLGTPERPAFNEDCFEGLPPSFPLLETCAKALRMARPKFFGEHRSKDTPSPERTRIVRSC
ncbi:hypothetical protein M407DRAFT_32828 [Tulasnella calospora MUT 4182]|uniref:Uncharacterized protein n=1 Tax=Tulasnella calospora MUT 4182 TaxID=1051891 RepID=A0A0C3K7V3_9AGAM|nr:hypothetical protein M407DRAFT_32828 [Tulasnella calospora MUT 4182]